MCWFMEFEQSSKQRKLSGSANGTNLQIVLGSKLFSLLDGFSSYKQVSVAEQYWLKTTFLTKWGTFAYRKMPFGLMNVGATFKRDMEIAFRGLVGHCVVVYLYGVTIFSKKREDHFLHLK